MKPAVCEDYDFWLRLLLHTPIDLIDRLLTVKFGGHSDQLSTSHWGWTVIGFNRWKNLLASQAMSKEQKIWVWEILTQKCQILEQVLPSASNTPKLKLTLKSGNGSRKPSPFSHSNLDEFLGRTKGGGRSFDRLLWIESGSYLPHFRKPESPVGDLRIGRIHCAAATGYLLGLLPSKIEGLINSGIAGYGQLEKALFIANRVSFGSEKSVLPHRYSRFPSLLRPPDL